MCHKVNFYESCVGSFTTSCSNRRWASSQAVECAESAKKGTGIFGCKVGTKETEERYKGTYQCDQCFEKSMYERKNNLG